VANASVNGNVLGSNQEAILVQPGATLVVGTDQSGGGMGAVTIGNTLTAAEGYHGIKCATDGVSLGGTVKDVVLPGQSTLVIEGQENWSIDAEDFCQITLTASPVIGQAPTAVGFGGCTNKSSQIARQAIAANGRVNLTFKNGTVQCVEGSGFHMTTSLNGNGNPFVVIDNTTIQNTDIGIYASAGNVAVSNSTIRYNYNGIEQDFDGVNNGAIDLSDGGNTVVCSSSQESSLMSTTPGVDVYNLSIVPLNADNVAWDTPGPDYFSCDTTLTHCACELASCTNDAGSDDMDAVQDSTRLGGITTVGNTQSPNGCH
jgi:hypothetical protein